MLPKSHLKYIFKTKSYGSKTISITIEKIHKIEIDHRKSINPKQVHKATFVGQKN